ncbi:MAG: protein-L-isoaspartate(D-aspartate) O-methyltransferase [Cellvibrionaceae bacterium]|nr:protein-L-isoaspartate(D-aspartate) O-methyltransferase [Cellvibrionaceae bacterium]
MTSERTRERMIQRLVDQGISNPLVLARMRQTPRHLFLDEALAHRAYEDTALPIGFRQTLSQPYIVAKMTQCLLEAAPRLDNVLEIGTGSGYQTAILAPLVKHLFSVERIQVLQQKARERLYQLKCHNVKLRVSDGNLGLSANAPYDAILSAAAPACIPESLKQQLGPDGVLVIPVGEQSQQMTMVMRQGESSVFQEQIIENVRFVPLLSGVVR